MLTAAQKSLVKRAQRQAQLADEEYRDLWRSVSHWDDCDTSTDPRLGDRHVDTMIALLEAIYWRRVDEGQIQHAPTRNAVFVNRQYWAQKNQSGKTSRDTYAAARLQDECKRLANALQQSGYPIQKIWGIQNKLTGKGPQALKAALTRTLDAHKNKQIPT